MYTDQEIIEMGMNSLVKALRIVDTERFISGTIRAAPIIHFQERNYTITSH